MTTSNRVFWAETDASGRFHFTAPMRWAENVEHEILGAAGIGPSGFPRRAVNSSYLRSLRAGDPYTVDLVVERIGKTSISYSYQVLSEDAVCVEGSYTVVHVDEAGRPTPVPDTVRAALAQHVRPQAA